jgi:SH3-like domain-containing protein
VLHFETERITLTINFDMETNVNNTNEPQHDAKLPVMCCFNCVSLGVKPTSGKHWCVNDKSYLSGWISQPHINKCNLHVLEK